MADRTVLDEIAGERSLALAAETWGAHPMDWPSPPTGRPRLWRRVQRQRLRNMEAVFGRLDDAAFARFHEQARLGQSVHEDCGGYLLRCYRAMLGLPVEAPYTYRQAVTDLMDRAAQEATDAG